MAAVEDAAPVVVEAPQSDPQARVPVPEVRHARDDRATGAQPSGEILEQRLRLTHVLEHVGGDDDVVPAAHLVGDTVLEVGLHERVDPVAHTGMLLDIHAGDLVAVDAQLGRQRAVGASEVQHPRGPAIGEPGQDPPVRRVGVELPLVRATRERHLPRPEAHLLGAIPQHLPRHVLGVLDAVHVADLVAVVRRDRNLLQPLPRLEQLQDDLRVEVEAVRVLVERDRAERVDAVGAVPAVPLAEVGADHGVLEPRQDPVPHVLVERHPTPAGRARLHHP